MEDINTNNTNNNNNNNNNNSVVVEGGSNKVTKSSRSNQRRRHKKNQNIATNKTSSDQPQQPAVVAAAVEVVGGSQQQPQDNPPTKKTASTTTTTPSQRNNTSSKQNNNNNNTKTSRVGSRMSNTANSPIVPHSFSCAICLHETTILSHTSTNKKSKQGGSGASGGSLISPQEYIAIGRCDHAICSLCALRIRCKSKNNTCALCKTTLEFMFLFKLNLPYDNHKTVDSFVEALSMVAYPWPNDLSQVDLLDLRVPDCQVDAENKLIYLRCPDLYYYMENLKSLHCPIRNCGRQTSGKGVEENAVITADPKSVLTNGTSRFRNIQQLLSHLSKEHNGMTMCKLCLEHRPLFISEHEVFSNANKYKQHLQGYSSASNSATLLASNKNSQVHLLGHPECKLCKIHLFDTQQLYQHMQREHYSCTLCDREMMFRYYKDLPSLREHHNEMHYVCNLCHRDPNMRQSDILYAFKQFVEFSNHMKDVHRVYDASRYLVTAPPSKRADKRDTNNNNKDVITCQDINVGTASPFPAPPVSGSGNGGNAERNRTTPASNRPIPTTSHYRNSILSNIPTNMTIAGRVTGTGRFANMGTEEVEALQALIEDSSSSHQQFHEQSSVVVSVNESRQHFPTLSGESDAKTIHILHPLSLANKKTVANKDQAATTTASSGPEASSNEKGGLSRQQALAEAFGVGDASSPITPLLSAHRLREVMEHLGYLHLSDYYLASPLYPWEVIVWAKRNKGELLKIENKLVGFLSAPAGSNQPKSMQFKPMPYALRCVVHLYAKYCHLNSYEYDPEPRRYVSLVRNPDSGLPKQLISSAMNIPINVINSASSQQQQQSSATMDDQHVIYFVLKEGLCSTWMSGTDATKTKTTGVMATTTMQFNDRLLVVGEVIDSIRSILHYIREDYHDRFTSFYDKPGVNEFYDHVAVVHHDVVQNNISMDINLDYVLQSAPHVIGIGFYSKYAAILTLLYLQEGDFWEYHGFQPALELLRYYKLESSFTMPEFDFSVLNWTTPAQHGDDDVTNEEAQVVVNDVDGNAQGDGWDEDDVVVPTGEDFVVVECPSLDKNDTQPLQSSSLEKCETEQSDEMGDWEEVVNNALVHNVQLNQETAVVSDNVSSSTAFKSKDDEWSRFLAEKRATVKVEQKGTDNNENAVSSGGLYVPKRTVSTTVNDQRSQQVKAVSTSSSSGAALYVPKKSSSGRVNEMKTTADLSSWRQQLDDIPQAYLTEHYEAVGNNNRESESDWTVSTSTKGHRGNNTLVAAMPTTIVTTTSKNNNAIGVTTGQMKDTSGGGTKVVKNRFTAFDSESDDDDSDEEEEQESA